MKPAVAEEVETKPELDSMIEFLQSNLEKFEMENSSKIKIISDKVLSAYDLGKQTSLEEQRKVDWEQSKAENKGCFSTVHLWRMDDNDYTMYHSYHPSYLKDFLSNYETYIQRKDPLDDLSVES